MSNLRQAAELALEIIETHHGEFDYANEITALRAALAEPEQEPVAWEQFYPDIGKPQLRQEPSITKTGCGILTLHLGFDDLPDGTKFYTTPPKQEPRNFCPRCGKRTADLTVIHTCTPPEGGHQ